MDDILPGTPIPPLDLAAQYRQCREAVDAAALRVLASGRYVLGDEVKALEAEVAHICGTADALGVASGTDALLLALLAAGVGPGDEVITSAFSFIATAAAISRTGARPVFADIEPETFNLDPAAVEAAVTPRTRAIVPVHVFGQMADVSWLGDVARDHGLLIVEDACQALGATWGGRAPGATSAAACFSFYPTKNLGAAGDGGMVVTNDPDLADRVDVLRRQGCRQKYHAEALGFNSRLDELQAAILRAKLPWLADWTLRRRWLAAIYRRGLSGLRAVEAPAETLGAVHVYHQFTVRVTGEGRRDGLLAHLQAQGIGAGVYYPEPIHRQALYSREYAGVHLPETERACREVLSLPMYPELAERQVRAVCREVRAYLEGAGDG